MSSGFAALQGRLRRSLAAAALAALSASASAQQADVAAGRALFVARCAVCHGVNADGQSNLARLLNPKPANLLISTLSADARNRIVRKGGAAVGRSSVMPVWEAELAEADLVNVIAYVASIAPTSTGSAK